MTTWIAFDSYFPPVSHERDQYIALWDASGNPIGSIWLLRKGEEMHSSVPLIHHVSHWLLLPEGPL